jgi:AAA family ATP:ADP antiporter
MYRSTLMRDLLKRAFPLQRRDLPRGILLIAYLFFIISAYQVARVARDALFLGQFPAEFLPYADISVFALVGVVVAAYIRMGERAGFRRTLIVSLLLFGLSGLAFAALDNWMNPKALSPLFYVWVGVFGVLAPAQGWTLANYVVTPREAKRLFGLVAAGASLGATFGALLTKVLAERVGAGSLPVLMAVLVFIATVIFEILWRRRPAGLADLEPEVREEETPKGLRESLQVVSTSPYLRVIAGIIGFSSLVTFLIGWQFKAIVQKSILSASEAGGGTDALASFIATFEGTASIACLFIQVLLTAGLLRRFGLRTILFALPVGLFAGSLGLLVAGGTLVAVLVPRAIDRVVRYSIDRPAVELLYLPVPLSVKLPAKSFIDTVVWRVGDAGFGGLTVLAFVSLGGLTAVQLTWVTIPLIAVWIAIAALTYRRYIGTLEESVQQHRLDVERAASPVLERATTEMLASRLDQVDPKEILYALDLMNAESHRTAHPAVRGLLDHPASEVRRRAIEILGTTNDRTLLPQVEVLLRDHDLGVRTEALLFLARHGDIDPVAGVKDLGEFTDASVRSAVVTILTRLGEEHHMAAHVLFKAMADEKGEAGRQTRQEAARLAERLPVVFVEPLRELIEDEDPEVAGAAIRAAGSHGAEPFADLLVGRLGDKTLGADARDALASAGTVALKHLARVLDDPATIPEVLYAVAGVLEQIGSDEAAGVLADRILAGNSEFQRRALRVLGRMRDAHPQIVIDPWALEAVLGAEILGHYRSYQILSALELSTLEEEPTTRGLRSAMMEELERIFLLLGLLYPQTDSRSAWEALRSGNPVLHDQALDLLESQLRPAMRMLLIPLIDPEIPGAERLRIAERLSGTPVDSPAEAVKALAATGDPWLRSCAAHAIGAQCLHELEGYFEEWQHDPDRLLRETIRQARKRLEERRAESGRRPKALGKIR